MSGPWAKTTRKRSVETLNQERRAAWEAMTRRQIAPYGGELERRGDTDVVKAPLHAAAIIAAVMNITNPTVIIEVS